MKPERGRAVKFVLGLSELVRESDRQSNPVFLGDWLHPPEISSGWSHTLRHDPVSLECLHACLWSMLQTLDLKAVSWYATEGHSQGHIVFRLPIYTYIPLVLSLWREYLRNTLGEFRYIWERYQLGLKDELSRFWWSKVTGTSQNMLLALTLEFIISQIMCSCNRNRWWIDDIFDPKGQYSALLQHHNVLQKHVPISGREG